MSKLRSKFIAVLAVLFCALLVLSTALFIPSHKDAEASSTDNGLNVGNLIKSGTGTNIIIDRSNLTTLYTRLSGSASYSAVESLAAGKLNGQEIRAKASGQTAVTLADTVGEFTVNFGDMDWIPTYLSTNSDNEVILTLWLAKNTTVYSSNGNTSGTPYNWNDFSTENSNVSESTLASDMYSTSKVRSYLVGSMYASKSGLSDPDKTGIQSSTWANFINKYGNLIATPQTVSWQETQTAREFRIKKDTSTPMASDLPNESWNKPSGTPVWGGQTEKIYKNTNYGLWQTDKIWLPSMSETGDYNTWYGLWRLSANQIKNPTYSYWLRSGNGSDATQAIYISSAGVFASLATTATSAGGQSLTVRPAFHLNLTKLEYFLPAPKDVENTYTGSEQKLVNLTDKPDWYSQYTTAYDNISNITVGYPTGDGDMLNATDDGYEVTVTIPSGSNYRWADGTDKSTPKTFKFKIKKKQVRVQFAPTPNSGTITATSGDFDNYPTATCVLNDICEKDREGKDNYATNYPKLKLQYRSASGASSDKQPTEPGTYTVSAEIDPEVINKNYEIISDSTYPNPITFIVKKVEVTKPSLKSNTFTYNGNEQGVEIQGLSADNETETTIVYTVKKGNTVIVSEGKANSFTVKDAGEDYTITYSIPSDKKATHAWAGENNANDIPETFKVEQAELTITLARSDGASSWQWDANTEVKVKLTVAGVCGDDDIKLSVYYTNSDGSGENTPVRTQEDGYYLITIPKLAKGENYKLICTVSNDNYKIRGATDGKLEQAFKIIAAQSSFNESDLVWQYTNGGTDKYTFKDGNEVIYNGKPYTVSLDDSNLEEKGVKVDTTYAPITNGLDGDITGMNVNTYTVQVKIVTLDDYEHKETLITFTWYITPADVDLSSLQLQWKYRARMETHDYVDGVPYEGGKNALNNGGLIEVFIFGLPEWLTPVYADTAQYSNTGYEINRYTAKITKLTSSNSNYKSAETLTDAEGKEYGWVTLTWEIVQHVLRPERWDGGDYSGGYVTESPWLVTSPYTVHLRYEYYDTPECDGAKLNFDADNKDNNELTYEEGTEKTYYVLAIIDENYPDDVKNWALDDSDDVNNPYKFTVGANKTPVEVKVTAGGTYDGTPKVAKIALVSPVDGIDSDAFTIEYYKAGSNTPLGEVAPTDAGSYYVTVTLKAGYADYYIKGTKTFEFTIETLKLKVPPAKLDNLTYDGTERDIAAPCGLPEDWQKYVTITITSKTPGVNNPAGYTIKVVADYEVIFRLKNGINDNADNVLWDDADPITQKKTTVSIVTLTLHAVGWEEDGYDSYIAFTEKNVSNFVVYTVYDEDGKVVDKATAEKLIGTYTVKVTVADEHIGNVEIVFNDGVSNQYEFITTGGQAPVKVTVPTIADLVFNGVDQTFVVNYGGFEEYIEIDLSLSNEKVLTQFDSGKYTVYFKIKSGKNAIWAETEDRKPIAVTFEMKPLILEDPKVAENQTFTYNGSEITAILNIDAAIRFLDVVGDITAINAGEYYFTLSIKELYAGNVVWASAGEKSVDWTIEKAKISVKWTNGDVPELDIPEEFKDVDIEYVIKDETGKEVSKDELEPGKKYTVTATLSDGSSANYEFVDDSGKTLKNPAKTDGFGFEIKNKNSSFPWWIIALIAGVLLLLAVLIVVLVKRRQTADGEDEFDDFYDDFDDEYDFDEDIEEDFDDDFGEEY